MRLPIVLLVLVTAASAHADSIKIGNKPYAAGAKWIDEKSTIVKATIEANGQPVPATFTDIENKTIEVLEAKGDVITKEKVTYQKRSKSQMIAGTERGKPDPLEGKAFTLTAGTPVAVDPAIDADAVRTAESRFGKPDHVRLAVGGREYTKGKVVDLAAGAGPGLFGDDSDVSKFALEYTGMTGKNAVFKLDVAATTRSEPRMKLDLAGTVVVDPVTAEALDVRLTGTVKSVAAHRLDGTMTLSSRRTMTR